MVYIHGNAVTGTMFITANYAVVVWPINQLLDNPKSLQIIDYLPCDNRLQNFS